MYKIVINKRFYLQYVVLKLVSKNNLFDQRRTSRESPQKKRYNVKRLLINMVGTKERERKRHYDRRILQRMG